jgi:hypothetical protein
MVCVDLRFSAVEMPFKNVKMANWCRKNTFSVEMYVEIIGKFAIYRRFNHFTVEIKCSM